MWSNFPSLFQIPPFSTVHHIHGYALDFSHRFTSSFDVNARAKIVCHHLLIFFCTGKWSENSIVSMAIAVA